MMSHKQVPMKNLDGTINADYFVAVARDALTLYGAYAGTKFLYKLGASAAHVAFAQRLNTCDKRNNVSR